SRNNLTWQLDFEGKFESSHSSHDLSSIQSNLQKLFQRLPARRDTVESSSWMPGVRNAKPHRVHDAPFGPDESPWEWLEATIHGMAKELGADFAFAPAFEDLDGLAFPDFEKYQRRLERKEQ